MSHKCMLLPFSVDSFLRFFEFRVEAFEKDEFLVDADVKVNEITNGIGCKLQGKELVSFERDDEDEEDDDKDDTEAFFRFVCADSDSSETSVAAAGDDVIG